MYQHPTEPPATSQVVGAQADLLMRRLQELERMLSAREWWLLGRHLPEAKILAEVTSLLAVARAELDQVLVQFCGRSPAFEMGEMADESAATTEMDPASLSQQRELAGHMLQTLHAALPPTLTFARQLAPYAQRAGMPAPGVETLGIVIERLTEAQEAIQMQAR